jgi:hypothetical protein
MSIPTLGFVTPYSFHNFMRKVEEGTVILIDFTEPRIVGMEDSERYTRTWGYFIRCDNDYLVIDNPSVGTWAIWWDHIAGVLV